MAPQSVQEEVTVLVVEDHQATLEGLVLGLERYPTVKVIGNSSTAKEGLSLAFELKPDVIVLDLHLPDSSSARSLVEDFQRSAPESKIIVYSAESRMAFINAVISMGVSAYLLKAERTQTLAETITKVMKSDQPVISKEVETTQKKITPSEQEVLHLIGKGLKYQEIADHRCTSMSTVRKQTETLLLKLNLETREQLIAWAVENGYGSDYR